MDEGKGGVGGLGTDRCLPKGPTVFAEPTAEYPTSASRQLLKILTAKAAFKTSVPTLSRQKRETQAGGVKKWLEFPMMCAELCESI